MGTTLLASSVRASDEGREVRGVVRDAQTGELLSKVRVQIANPRQQSLTGGDGRFRFLHLSPAEYLLKISTVGYRLWEKRLDLRDSDVSLEVALSPDSFGRVDTVQVRSGPLEADVTAGATSVAIEGNEIETLSGVLTGDPLRAVQSLPGVSSDDDFEARFTVHGAPFERVGVYLDGVLLHEPFHTVDGAGPSGSISIFSGDLIGAMTLETEGYNAKFGDRTAGALDISTRDGSSTETDFRLNVSAIDASATAEGPLGSAEAGSWLATFRKSYLQYVLNLSSDQPSMAFGFTDGQAEATYKIGPAESLKLELVDGDSLLNAESSRDLLGLNSAMLANYDFNLASLSWQYAPSSSFLLDSHAAFMRERYDDTNTAANLLGGGSYREWAWNSNAAWTWAPNAILDAGASVRNIRADGFSNYYYTPSDGVLTNGFSGHETLAAGFAQQFWTAFSGRLSLSAGARWDRSSLSGVGMISPRASVGFAPWRSAKLTANWGQYAQFPDLQYSSSIFGSPRLLPERAMHYVLSFEQRMGKAARLRIEGYERNDRDLLFQPLLEARLIPGGIMPDNYSAPILNALRGYAKGVEIFLQRRSANRLNGWISYQLGYTRDRDSAQGLWFPSDQDQRHTLNAYLGYRIRPSVNLSTKWSYGSGFPIPGFFQFRDGEYFLAAKRNQAPLGPYNRADVRVNKQRVFGRWKMTIYAEVLNVFNHANYRFDSYNGYDPTTGQVYISIAKMFPLLPSAGVTLDF